mgnify:CR=1 FL=1
MRAIGIEGTHAFQAQSRSGEPIARRTEWIFIDEMPRTSTGKILKAALRERYRDWRGTK